MTVYREDFGSLVELADAAREGQALRAARAPMDSTWAGATFDGSQSLAVNGWEKPVPEAERIAEAAIATVEREHDVPVFTAHWDVAGSEPDVGRFLMGEPENMIDYLPVQAPKEGRVIALCASVSYSASIRPGTIKRRGQGIVALAIALTRLGFNVELWADVSADGAGSNVCHTRTLVKGANDELDLARIMFAYAHPAMLRCLHIPLMETRSAAQRHDMRHDAGMYGAPILPEKNLPEGTIYLPGIYSDRDVPEAAEMLRDHLTELGIIES